MKRDNNFPQKPKNIKSKNKKKHLDILEEHEIWAND